MLLLLKKYRVISMKKIHNELTNRFFQSILNLKTIEDCQNFFEDVCTIKEIQDMSQRLEVAYLRNDGMSYQEVLAQTGVSTATISRVNKCLNYGSGGYKKALSTLPERKDIEK